MVALHRYELIFAGGRAVTAALSGMALACPRSCGRFFHDTTMDAQNWVAHAMASAVWAMHRVDGRIDGALFFRLHRDTASPRALAGLGRPAMRFAIEQIARRRGMQPIAGVEPIWAFGFDETPGFIA